MNGKASRLSRRCWIVTAVIATLIYLTYRAIFTLNFVGPYSCLASLSLYLAEMYGAFLMFLYFFQIWELVEPEPVQPLRDRTVDVFIPTYNEDPELLRGTISAALALDYPHETYVLDDGNRPAVAELAEELGAHYINRPTNLHAKAGNLNHAMEITHGEFVVIFDADHVSRRDFITRLLGYFQDEKLGFIQTPHSFYNFDNFHGALNYRRARYWEEGELFYNVTQPGKNYWNAVSFCGSAAMFRRTALEDVGLVATETITEDMHTGLRMHAQGWNSLFINERLVSGQAANDVTTFNTQRLRWGEGNLGVFAFDNPLTMKGLTVGQRICYLGSMLSWTTGLQKLQLYAAPVMMLLTGIAPVNELSWTLGIITLCYMLTIWIAVVVTSNGHGHLIGTELTHMASFWTQIKSTYRALFKRRKTKFVVTAKRGRQSDSIVRFILPQCIYIAASGLAIGCAVTRYATGISGDLAGLAVGTLLVLVHCWFAVEVIRRALRRKTENDEAWRHPCAIHVSYRYTGSADQSPGLGVSVDLNERGLGFHAFEELEQRDDLEISISALGSTATSRCRLVHKQLVLASKSKREGDVVCWRYGVEFVDPSTEALAVIWRICSDYATARHYDCFETQKGHRQPDSICQLLSKQEVGMQRVNMPIGIHLPGERHVATVTEGISATSCLVLAREPIQRNETVRVSLATPMGHIHGVAKVEAVQSALLGATPLELIRLKFGALSGESRSLLLTLCNGQDEAELKHCVRLRPPEKQLPNLRPAALTGSLAMAAAGVAIAFNLIWYQQHIMLVQAQRTESLSQEMRVNLQTMLGEVIDGTIVDDQRLVQLREVFRKTGDKSSLTKLNSVLMEREVTSFTARLCRAESLEESGRLDEAWVDYQRLLASDLNEIAAEQRWQLFASAARNAANRTDPHQAVLLFERIDTRYLRENSSLLREYGGQLAASGLTEKAIATLEDKKELTSEDRMLLASLHSSLERFETAIEYSRQVLHTEPGNAIALHSLADNAMWLENYPLAASHLHDWLQGSSADWQAKRKLAECQLRIQQHEKAIELFTELYRHKPFVEEVRDGFVEACLGCEQLGSEPLAMLRELAIRHAASGQSDRMTEMLVHALSNRQQEQTLLPLVKLLVQSRPQWNEMRLRLVDLLESDGKHDEAHQHLQWLLANSGERATSDPRQPHSLVVHAPHRRKPLQIGAYRTRQISGQGYRATTIK